MQYSMEEPNQNRMDQAIRRMASGDRDALRELYTESARAVYAYALSLLKNASDAEDVLQDTFLRAWNAAPSYQSRQKPMAWLITIAKNLALSRLRTARRTEPLPDEPHYCAPEGFAIEDRLLLEACLNTLSDAERQIVVLHATGGLKHREIAKLLSLPLGTVLSKYRRAIGKLRNILQEEAV